MKRFAVVFAMMFAPAIASADPPRRDKDEMMVLYTTAFAYGVGTGLWVDLEAKPKVDILATTPFVGFTIATVGGVAALDAIRPFRRGEPATIAAGMVIAFAGSIYPVAAQRARAERVGTAPWSPEDAATVLWTSTTAGAITGTILAVGARPSHGQVSFAESASLWSGAITSLAVGAMLPSDSKRIDTIFVTGGIAHHVGFGAGVLFAPLANPSVMRMRVVDLGGIGGGLLAVGIYAAIAQRSFDARAAGGVTAIGATLGLASAWMSTMNMRVPASARLPSPTLVAVPGGAAIGISGSL